jgi:hypothetical protein
MTGAIVGVLLRTVNPRGGRSMWSGCGRMPPSSRPGRRLWRGELLLSTRHAVRRKAASAPSINLPSAPLTIPLVCCDIHGFRRVSRGGEAMARRQKEERRVGSASRGIVRRLGCCSSRARHRVVPERAADGGIVYVWQARSASLHALRIHAQRVARYAPYNAHNCLPPKKLRREIP